MVRACGVKDDEGPNMLRIEVNFRVRLFGLAALLMVHRNGINYPGQTAA